MYALQNMKAFQSRRKKLGLEIQPPAVHSIPFVNQGCRSLIMSGFQLMIWEMIKF
jgi:hypothetical protein